jgi:hypothetical protein
MSNEQQEYPFVRFERGAWFAFPAGEGSAIGPFSDEEQAWGFLSGDPDPDEDEFDHALRLAERFGWIREVPDAD